MPTQKKPLIHPLESQRNLTALAVFALSAVGVGLMDSRLGVGALMCFFAVLATLWLFSENILAMRHTHWKKWPWIGFVIIVIEIVVPLYVGITKVYGKESDSHEFERMLNTPSQIPEQLVRPRIIYPPDIVINGNANNKMKGITSMGSTVGVQINGSGNNIVEDGQSFNAEKGVEINGSGNNRVKNYKFVGPNNR